MTSKELKVNTDRIGVLIGKGGSTKREIEEKTGTAIKVDSREGVVTVEGESPEGVLSAANLIEAINRGFSPERAFMLFKEEGMILDVIDLSPLADTPQKLERIRGRIIGRDGRSREQIEEMTETSISIFGKTVAIIGLFEQVKLARTAVEMLINGAPHETVYSFLDRRRREARQDLVKHYY
ncbi:MAG: KH domain-containing protein [Methanomicrobiales archaeon]|nr:KH domain-containing protein [Methanomicrobiales archaeon]